MHIFAILIVLLLGCTIVVRAVCGAFQLKDEAGWKRWIKVFGFLLIAIGAFGFFGAFFSDAGGLNWLPSNFEWPVGSAKGVLVMSDGKHIVPVQAPGRIQIYDSNWNYIRGWHIDVHCGAFRIHLAETNKIEVFAVRGQLRYLYGLDGTVLSSGSYAPRNYDDFSVAPESTGVPTRWWLWIFTDPFHSWICFMAGILLQWVTDPQKTKIENAAPREI